MVLMIGRRFMPIGYNMTKEQRKKEENKGGYVLKNSVDVVSRIPVRDVYYIQIYDDPYAYEYIRWHSGITAVHAAQLKGRRQVVIVWAYDRVKQIPGHRVPYIDGYSEVAEYYSPNIVRKCFWERLTIVAHFIGTQI